MKTPSTSFPSRHSVSIQCRHEHAPVSRPLNRLQSRPHYSNFHELTFTTGVPLPKNFRYRSWTPRAPVILQDWVSHLSKAPVDLTLSVPTAMPVSLSSRMVMVVPSVTVATLARKLVALLSPKSTPLILM